MCVYNLVYINIETDDPLNSDVKVQTFSTEEAAIAALKHDYETTLRDLKESSVLDVIHSENYENNAVIELGYDTQFEFQDKPEIEVHRSWRISKTTIKDA